MDVGFVGAVVVADSISTVPVSGASYAGSGSIVAAIDAFASGAVVPVAGADDDVVVDFDLVAWT